MNYVLSWAYRHKLFFTKSLCIFFCFFDFLPDPFFSNFQVILWPLRHSRKCGWGCKISANQVRTKKPVTARSIPWKTEGVKLVARFLIQTEFKTQFWCNLLHFQLGFHHKTLLPVWLDYKNKTPKNGIPTTTFFFAFIGLVRTGFITRPFLYCRRTLKFPRRCSPGALHLVADSYLIADADAETPEDACHRWLSRASFKTVIFSGRCWC